jgi:hypothetical protein
MISLRYFRSAIARSSVGLSRKASAISFIMTDSENWKERRNQVARYRAMEQETTDPLAARLLRDIVLDLEAELEGFSNDFSPS